jgi:uncharacterized membrane protein YjjB (DUF3815 family)
MMSDTKLAEPAQEAPVEDAHKRRVENTAGGALAGIAAGAVTSLFISGGVLLPVVSAVLGALAVGGAANFIGRRAETVCTTQTPEPPAD